MTHFWLERNNCIKVTWGKFAEMVG